MADRAYGRFPHRIFTSALVVLLALVAVLAHPRRGAAQEPSDQAGTLLLTANAPRAEVWVDGNLMGYTDDSLRFRTTLPKGQHNIKVKYNGASKDAVTYIVAGLASRVQVSFDYATVARPTDERAAPEGPKTGFHWPISTLETTALLFFAAVLSVIVFLLGKVVRNLHSHNRFDRYAVKKLMARGGMADIFRAYDPAERIEVALKVMHESLLNDEDLVRKFVREGELLSRLNRIPNLAVVKIHRYGYEKGSSPPKPFLALELLHGKTLLDVLKERRSGLDIPFACWVIRDTAAALAECHDEKIYHRDLTPDNIMLTKGNGLPYRGRGGLAVKLIDFGVAKHEYTNHGTLDGSIMGKPPYMSPEQCRAEKNVTLKTDIYSLGILFYALIEGKPPFVDPNPILVMKKHLEERPPYIMREIPSALRDLINDMLEKDPERRPRDMRDVIRRMEPYAGR